METGNKPLLHLRDWSLVRRVPGGEITILNSINLELRAGSWLAVLGANGSGKSSLLKYLASDDSPLGVSRAIMFQDPDEQIIASTVQRELTLGRPAVDWQALLEEFGLEQLSGLDPRLLSAGQKQRLVMAVSLGGGTEVLFCDEPTALQDDSQAVWVLDRLEKWRRQFGGTLVTTTCDRREALRADELLVLQDGCVVAHGPRDQLLTDPLVEQLLGPAAPVSRPVTSRVGNQSPSGSVLTMGDLGFQFHGGGGGFGGVNLEVGPGQRVGITGPNGCGKSTLLAAAVGARRPDQGTVTLAGKALYRSGTTDLDHGLALLAPQFPEYIFTRSSVAEEIALDPALENLEIMDLLATMGLPADIGPRNPHSLSSGQKRRLALGLVLFSERSLLLLDEPTAALDWRGRQLVVQLLAVVPERTALVIASHDQDFLREVGCHCLELGPEGLF